MVVHLDSILLDNNMNNIVRLNLEDVTFYQECFYDLKDELFHDITTGLNPSYNISSYNINSNSNNTNNILQKQNKINHTTADDDDNGGYNNIYYDNSGNYEDDDDENEDDDKDESHQKSDSINNKQWPYQNRNESKESTRENRKHQSSNITNHKKEEPLTDKVLRHEALKYKTRYGFKNGSYNAYYAATKRGVLNDICKHMNSTSTTTAHNKKSSTSATATNSNNKKRTNWTKEMIHKEALKYNTKKEFRKRNAKAYSAASKKGIVNVICRHMKKSKYETTRESSSNSHSVGNNHSSSANQTSNRHSYDNRNDSDNDNNSSSNHDNDNNRSDDDSNIDEINSDSDSGESDSNYEDRTDKTHSKKYRKCPCGSITKNATYNINVHKNSKKHLKYLSRTKNNSTYNNNKTKTNNASISKNKNQTLSSNSKTRTNNLHPRLKWTDEMLHQIALKYKTKEQFMENSKREYIAARRRGLLDGICKHMKISRSRQHAADNNNVTSSTQNIHSYDNTNHSSSSSFSSNKKKNSKHQHKKYYVWSEELIREEALKYKFRSEFSEGSNNAYCAANKRGILNNVCQHMKSKQTNGLMKCYEKKR